MPRTPKTHAARLAPGLPTRQQVLDFIKTADGPAGKREIARAFGLKGQEKIQLKALLKDMADEGLIDGKRTAYHRMGGVPKVTVLRIVAIDEGEAIAVPDNWQPDDGAPPPKLRLVEKGRSALKVHDRVLARTEEAGKGWRAFPMKKLAVRSEQVMGVVEIDAAGKGWLAPVDKRVRNALPIADLGGAEAGRLVLAEPAGRSPRTGVKVTEVLGDPFARSAGRSVRAARVQPDRDPQAWHTKRVRRRYARRGSVRIEAAAVGRPSRGFAPPADRRHRSHRRTRPR